MKRKINEIFYSLQGEGAHTGCPSVFVRFSGCNKRCSFCDTRHEDGIMMEDDELIARIAEYPSRWIILTGGEPSMWIDGEFVKRLKEETGKSVAIETNGSFPLPEEIDWVTVSPKCGMEGAGEYDILAAKADEVKVVDVGQALDSYFSYPCVTPATRFFLQPCYVEDKKECLRNTERTIRRVLDDPRWTLSVQTHRLLNIP